MREMTFNPAIPVPKKRLNKLKIQDEYTLSDDFHSYCTKILVNINEDGVLLDI